MAGDKERQTEILRLIRKLWLWARKAPRKDIRTREEIPKPDVDEEINNREFQSGEIRTVKKGGTRRTIIQHNQATGELTLTHDFLNDQTTVFDREVISTTTTDDKTSTAHTAYVEVEAQGHFNYPHGEQQEE